MRAKIKPLVLVLALCLTQAPILSFRSQLAGAAPYSSWNIETVDLGMCCSMILDSHDRPHIIYHPSPEFYPLNYVKWTGSDWNIETIATKGEDASIVLDSFDRPHISYCDTTVGLWSLKYARWTGTEWSIETVDDQRGDETSIALDSHDRPHIAYHDFSGILKYARWTGTEWGIETIDTEQGTGRYTQIALDSTNRPHILYGTFSEATLWKMKYAQWTGAEWSIETIGSGAYWSMVLDSQNRPHIFYTDFENNLKYARWTGTRWNMKTIDTGFSWSIVLGSGDHPHISYVNCWYRTNQDLKYARWTGTEWSIEIVDTGNFGYAPMPTALDSANRPHICYTDFTNFDLKYAKSVGTTGEVKPYWVSVNNYAKYQADLRMVKNGVTYVGSGTRTVTVKEVHESYAVLEFVDDLTWNPSPPSDYVPERTYDMSYTPGYMGEVLTSVVGLTSNVLDNLKAGILPEELKKYCNGVKNITTAYGTIKSFHFAGTEVDVEGEVEFSLYWDYNTGLSIKLSAIRPVQFEAEQELLETNIPVATVVKASSPPDPDIRDEWNDLGPLPDFPASINLGEWATIRIDARNFGGEASWQSINISFPDNPSTSNIQIVSYDGLRGAKIYGPGDEVGAGYGTTTTELSYPMVEGDDVPWEAGGSKYLEVKVKPEKWGTFTFFVKSVALDANGNYYSDPKKDGSDSPPPELTSTALDQQAEWVYFYEIDVIPPVSELRDRINHRLQQQYQYPLYLLDPDSFTTAVTTGWLTLTSPLTGNLTEKYDEFYWAGIDFDCLRTNTLIKAKQSLRRGDIASAEKYLQKSLTYEKLSNMSFEAATEVYIGNLDAAETLAQGIRKGCEEAVVFGVSVGVNPTTGKLFTTFTLG